METQKPIGLEVDECKKRNLYNYLLMDTGIWQKR